MFDLIKRMRDIIDRKDRVNFVLFFIGISLNSLLEIVSIGLILPFIALLGHPSLLITNSILSRFYQALHFQSFKQCMIFLAGFIIIIFVIKNVVLFILSFVQARFIYRKQAALSIRLFRAYLMCPYSYHLRTNLANLHHALGAVQLTMAGVLLPLLNLITELILVSFLFLLLFWKYPLLTMGIMVILGGALFGFFQIMKKSLRKWGEASGRHMMACEKQLSQGLGSIKESKLWGKESFFLQRYSINIEGLSDYQSRNEVIGKSPRLFIESIVIGLMMLAMIVYFTIGTPLEKIFTMLSLFAIVAVRLMPGLNRISAAWASIKFYKPFLDRIHNDLMNCEELERAIREKTPQGPVLSFDNNIELRNISFFYEATKTPALHDLSFAIQKNTTVGFVGSSGAGKSTAIDVILGLLDPSSGVVLVDGRDINENIRSWQQRIGYIPQAIYLCDDTIRNNVAFGLEPEEIDQDKVWKAIHLAQLEDFVRSLPEGLDTVIGDRGIRVSGGQKQRIGIARALYNDPEVLVMDEATAALDNETERDFMEALGALSGGKTLLIIAHRLSTVRCCDKIFFLKAGGLIGCGTYQELLDQCPDFSRMAGVGHF